MRYLMIVACFVPTMALAQQNDPELLQRTCAMVEHQRNTIMTAYASSEAKLAQVQEENTRLKAELSKVNLDKAKPAK